MHDIICIYIYIYINIMCTECFNTGSAAFFCPGCTKAQAHSARCSLKKDFSNCRDCERNHFFHIASHEGHHKATLWLVRTRGAECGRKRVEREVEALLERERAQLQKQAAHVVKKRADLMFSFRPLALRSCTCSHVVQLSRSW